MQGAKLAYYNQQSLEYEELDFRDPMEIVSLYGNISLRNNVPFAHVHVVLSDAEGVARGGHLLPGGTPVFACELMIEEFEGEPLIRQKDDTTGLTLWSKDREL